MEDFQAYNPEDVILENLEELSLRSALHREQVQAHLCELAAEIASDFKDSVSFLASLADHRLPLPSQKPPQSAREATENAILRSESTRLRVLLCIELGERLPHRNESLREILFPTNEALEGSSFNRISYQKNSYTDRAYELFAKLLPAPHAAYAHSFPSVCEDVYNRFSEFCILPLENSAEGRLNSFSRLIAEFDLKIVATCEVATGDGRSTRFALLRKALAWLDTASDLSVSLEIFCRLSDYPGAEDILSAARLCGLTPIRSEITAETVPNTESRLSAVFLIGKGDLLAFLLYLAMEAPTALPIGLYPHIPLREPHK